METLLILNNENTEMKSYCCLVIARQVVKVGNLEAIFLLGANITLRGKENNLWSESHPKKTKNYTHTFITFTT